MQLGGVTLSIWIISTGLFRGSMKWSCTRIGNSPHPLRVNWKGGSTMSTILLGRYVSSRKNRTFFTNELILGSWVGQNSSQLFTYVLWPPYIYHPFVSGQVFFCDTSIKSKKGSYDFLCAWKYSQQWFSSSRKTVIYLDWLTGVERNRQWQDCLEGVKPCMDGECMNTTNGNPSLMTSAWLEFSLLKRFCWGSSWSLRFLFSLISSAVPSCRQGSSNGTWLSGCNIYQVCGEMYHRNATVGWSIFIGSKFESVQYPAVIHKSKFVQKFGALASWANQPCFSDS